jgi:hypothetical protein
MTIESINEFLRQAGFNFVVYDMGRRMVRLTPQQFNQFENGVLTYPTPFQLHAWLGLLGWQEENKSHHFIWFLKLPLDELGKINPLARDELLHYLVNQLGQRLLTSEEGTDSTTTLAALPYGFTPGEESMAMFHAKAARILEHAPSRYYNHARDYLSGAQGYDQWAFVGMQGLAEVVARWQQDDNLNRLQQAIPQLPSEPFGQLCRFLEHEDIPAELATTLINRAKHDRASEFSRADLVAILRALSGCTSSRIRQSLIQQVLAEAYGTDIEILAAISGRCWEDLQDKDICRLFLECLANNTHGQSGFTHLLIDLLAIPGMREPVMQGLRDPNRSIELAQAMGQFFKQLGA